LQLPADMRERIHGRSDHRERPDHVDQRLGKAVLGRATCERAPDAPETGRDEREDQSAAPVQNVYRASPDAGSAARSRRPRGFIFLRLPVVPYFVIKRNLQTRFDFAFYFLTLFRKLSYLSSLLCLGLGQTAGIRLTSQFG